MANPSDLMEGRLYKEFAERVYSGFVFMSGFGSSFGKAGVYAAVAAFALSPSILLAVNLGKNDSESVAAEEPFDRFTPAGIDSELAEYFNLAQLRGEGDFQFTPAGKFDQDRSVTIVVRAPGKSASFVQSSASARAALVSARQEEKPVLLGMTSYNLGAAKGLQSFTPAPTAGIDAKADEPRLTLSSGSGFRLDSREGQRVVSKIGGDRVNGGMPRATAGLADDATDIGGSLKVLNGVEVTAGLRVEKEKNRTQRITDDQRDSQAVYVGTLITF